MGMVHIYTGDGKGKTSSATGLAIRCAGYGKKVKIYQFLKATPTGELESLKKLGIDVVRINTCESFYYDMTETEKQITKEETVKAVKTLFDEECDLVVLDEILCAVNNGILSADDVINIIKNKSQNTELVLTGRNMPQILTEYADYISEIKCVKHPYQNGVDARCGIDF